jgi:hypothetical protein
MRLKADPVSEAMLVDPRRASHCGACDLVRLTSRWERCIATLCSAAKCGDRRLLAIKNTLIERKVVVTRRSNKECARHITAVSRNLRTEIKECHFAVFEWSRARISVWQRGVATSECCDIKGERLRATLTHATLKEPGELRLRRPVNDPWKERGEGAVGNGARGRNALNFGWILYRAQFGAPPLCRD